MNHQGASEDRRSTSSNAAANPFRIGQGFAKTVYGLFQCLFRGIRQRFGASLANGASIALRVASKFSGDGPAAWLRGGLAAGGRWALTTSERKRRRAVVA
jgi:hypothetical protein